MNIMHDGILIIEVASSKVAYRIFSPSGERVDSGLLNTSPNSSESDASKTEFDVLEIVNDPAHPDRDTLFSLLKSVSKAARDMGVTSYYMVGTSPFRDKNGLHSNAGKAFQWDIKDKTGLELHNLTGSEEACYFAYASLQDPDIQTFLATHKKKPSLMLDMGGRSTEMVLVAPDGEKILKTDSAAFGRLSFAGDKKKHIKRQTTDALTNFLSDTGYKPTDIGGIIYGGGLTKRIAKTFLATAEHKFNAQPDQSLLQTFANNVVDNDDHLKRLDYHKDQITAASHYISAIKDMVPKAFVSHTSANLSKGAALYATQHAKDLPQPEINNAQKQSKKNKATQNVIDMGVIQPPAA